MKQKPYRRSVPPLADPVGSAKAAGLHYVTDDGPGIHRVRSGRGFRYLDASGRPVRNPDTLKRIRSLAIPPAWANVWICPSANGHLQATGRDNRGRKQYRYHPRWREVRDEAKYYHLIDFAHVLPRIRTRVEQDLAQPGLSRAKVLATVVRLLETTCIRVGNEEYARVNHSFGLTTLKDHHVEINGSTIRFTFRGKSGIRHAIDLNDRRLARIVQQCQDIPGHELFQYWDEQGGHHTITSTDVNDYLREVTGEYFTAKDFRTWAGTVQAVCALQDYLSFTSLTQARSNVVRAVERVAQRLGNTKAVCRKCYIHPAVFDAYLEGKLLQLLAAQNGHVAAQTPNAYSREEAAILTFLQERLQSQPLPTGKPR